MTHQNVNYKKDIKRIRKDKEKNKRKDKRDDHDFRIDEW